MKDILKWLIIALFCMCVITVAVLLVAPSFINVNRYKPEIERKLSEAIGRKCTINGNISISLFPAAVLHFSSLHIGNPSGFSSRDFLFVRSFDTRVRLLPLFSKRLEIRHVILDGVKVVLEKNREGKKNWESLYVKRGKPSSYKKKSKPVSTVHERPSSLLSVLALDVGKFTVTDGSILFIDDSSGVIRKICDVMLSIDGISFDRPIPLSLSFTAEDYPVAISGKLGPVYPFSKDKPSLPFTFHVKALSIIEADLSGSILKPYADPSFAVHFHILPFSPRKMLIALGRRMTERDKELLNKAWAKGTLEGGSKALVLKGDMGLDSTHVNFHMAMDKKEGISLSFETKVDHIDLDRYMHALSPPEKGANSTLKGKNNGITGRSLRTRKHLPLKRHGSKRKEDKGQSLSFMAGMSVQGLFTVDHLTIHGARLENFSVKVSGKDDSIQLKPISCKMYGGDLVASARFIAARKVPISFISLRLKGVSLRPLLHDIGDKSFMEGVADCNLDLRFRGIAERDIKRTLSGKGHLVIHDGALLGIDIPGIVRNAKALMGKGERSPLKDKTSFSRLDSPFILRKGIWHTEDTEIVSSHLSMSLMGDADLVREILDLRLVANYKSKKKGKEKIISLPFLIRGSFSSPKIALDLAGTLEERLNRSLLNKEKLDTLFDKDMDKGEKKKVLKDAIKGLFKDLLSR